MATTVDPALFMLEILQAEYLMHAEQGSFDPSDDQRSLNDPPDEGIDMTPRQRKLMISIVERSQILTQHAFKALEFQGWVMRRSEVDGEPAGECETESLHKPLHSMAPSDVERVTEAFAVIRRAGMTMAEVAAGLGGSSVKDIDRGALVEYAHTAIDDELISGRKDTSKEVAPWLRMALHYVEQHPREVQTLILELESDPDDGEGFGQRWLKDAIVDAMQYVASGQATAEEMQRMIEIGEWAERHANRIEVSTHERREWIDRGEPLEPPSTVGRDTE